MPQSSPQKPPNPPPPGRHAALLAATLAAAGLLAAFAPAEKTLGGNMRLVYLHGAWVWAALALFAAAGLAGLAGLAARRPSLQAWSLALGRTALLFWLASLPMSLLVMKLNWGGFFFDEPRWRTPLAFAVTGVLLQAGLAVLDRPALTSLANLGFAAALLAATWNLQSVLHPDSPILTSESTAIRAFFASLLVLVLLAEWQAAGWIRAGMARRPG